MNNYVILNNPAMCFLVRQAVAEKIKKLLDSGYSEQSFEVRTLRKSLGELKELNGRPNMKEVCHD